MQMNLSEDDLDQDDEDGMGGGMFKNNNQDMS